jgi:hypothetical protein
METCMRMYNNNDLGCTYELFRAGRHHVVNRDTHLSSGRLYSAPAGSPYGEWKPTADTEVF